MACMCAYLLQTESMLSRLSMTDTTMLPLMLVVVIVGLLRVFHALYHFIKQFSGKAGPWCGQC